MSLIGFWARVNFNQGHVGETSADELRSGQGGDVSRNL
jgi:hypothetical protein